MKIKCFDGKFVKVVFIAVSVEEANKFLEKNTNCVVLKKVGELVFIADNNDLGENDDK